MRIKGFPMHARVQNKTRKPKDAGGGLKRETRFHLKIEQVLGELRV